jgi:RNA polymerase sigma-70 factor (ECF subfamily)
MIQDAMDELPNDYREVFVLKHLEELPYEQISQLTGDSVGALKVRAHRARKLLLEAVASQENDCRRKRPTPS